jgi:transcriptional regulator with XRE-family HTH domain
LIRKQLGLTQEEFAERLGIKRENISKYEKGNSAPSAAGISVICREFCVSERWLRYGEGEMLSEDAFDDERHAALNRLRKLLDSEPESFQTRFISMMSKLTADEWALLERKMREAMGENGKTEIFRFPVDRNQTTVLSL